MHSKINPSMVNCKFLKYIIIKVTTQVVLNNLGSLRIANFEDNDF